MIDPERIAAFREKLDHHHVWPSLYTFKFIVPAAQEEKVKNIFPHHVSTSKKSRQGKYASITFHMMMPGSDAVVQVYQSVAHIEGLIAL
jgi:hypothetical protein